MAKKKRNSKRGMVTFYWAPRTFWGGMAKKPAGKFKARNHAEASEKAQQISNRIGKRIDFWWKKSDAPRMDNPKRNPLPVGKLVTVKARRRSDGRVELYKA